MNTSTDKHVADNAVTTMRILDAHEVDCVSGGGAKLGLSSGSSDHARR